MQEFFTGLKGLNPDLVGPLGGMLIMGIIVIPVVCMIQWRKFRQAGMQTALTQQMLERGMSASEIAQVLSASLSKTAKDQPVARSESKKTADYKS